MTVKRFTIELDDVPDGTSGTSGPVSLMPKGDLVPKHQENTDIPSRQIDYQQNAEAINISGLQSRKETIGRTPSDLVFTFMNRPEFMAVILVFFAFFISVNLLKSISDLWIPAVIGCVLNLVWFGIRGVRFLLNRDDT